MVEYFEAANKIKEKTKDDTTVEDAVKGKIVEKIKKMEALLKGALQVPEIKGWAGDFGLNEINIEEIKKKIGSDYEKRKQDRIEQFRTKLTAGEAAAMGEGSLEEKIRKLEEERDKAKEMVTKINASKAAEFKSVIDGNMKTKEEAKKDAIKRFKKMKE